MASKKFTDTKRFYRLIYETLNNDQEEVNARRAKRLEAKLLAELTKDQEAEPLKIALSVLEGFPEAKAAVTAALKRAK